VAVTEVGTVTIRQALGVSRVRTEVDAAAFPQGEALPSEKVGYLPREALDHPLEGPAARYRIPTPQLLCGVPDRSLYARIRALAVALYTMPALRVPGRLEELLDLLRVLLVTKQVAGQREGVVVPASAATTLSGFWQMAGYQG
jgi:hypothetical protein